MADLNRAQPEWEYDTLESDQFEFPGEWELTQEIGMESPFDEVEEMELASQLLEVTDEAELDQFLGSLIKKAWRGVRKIGRNVLRPLGGVLKAVAKKALPYLAGAAGTFFGGPVGGALGASLGSALSKAMEMEFEGLSPEDQEFEMARRFVRLAGATAKQAALAEPGVDPQVAVRNALIAAAHQHLPGLSNGRMPSAGSMAGKRRSGRWLRRGRTIILFGV
jgi:hypothetical protein